MTNTINLDKLEQEALASFPAWVRNRPFGQLNVQDDKYMLGDADAIYAESASPAVVLELIRRLCAAEQDAARYRWLVTQIPCSIADDLKCGIHEIGDEIDDAIRASAEIDAAIAAQGASHD